MNNQDFGKFISTLRKEKGLTQKELGEKLNLTDKAISRWENGKSYPDIEILENISKELDISISELIACKKIETKEEAIAITEGAYIDEVKQGNKKIKKVIVALIIAILVIVSIFIANIYGDKIYSVFVFSQGDVIKISDSEFRVAKDKPDAFEEYMLDNGWYGSNGNFENESQKAIYTFSEKRLYNQYDVHYVEKFDPLPGLLDVYGKGPYDIYYEKDKVIFSNEVDYVTDKSTWSVAWGQDENTAEMQTAKLVVEEDGTRIYEKDIEINVIEDKNDFIHGWNCFVLVDSRFEIKYDNPKSSRAYIILTDSNDIEYKVCLNRTEFHEQNPDDASFDIIIKYKNSSFSIWDYHKFWTYLNDSLS